MNPKVEEWNGKISVQETESQSINSETFIPTLKKFLEIFQDANIFTDFLKDRIKIYQKTKALKDEENNIRMKSVKEWSDNDRIRLKYIKDELNEISSFHLDIRINCTPYSHFLDIICYRIAEAINNIEKDLMVKGITLEPEFYKKLLEGPSHEAAHQLRYVLSTHGYSNLTSEQESSMRIANRKRLVKGDSHMNGYRWYGIYIQLIIEEGVLKCKMECSYPFEGNLEEDIKIALAPKEPTVGDSIFIVRKIIQNCNREHPLFKEMINLVCDFLQEVSNRSYYTNLSRSELEKLIIQDLTGMDSEWFFNNVFYPDLAMGEKALSDEIIRLVGDYIDLE